MGERSRPRRRSPGWAGISLFTIGHSTRSIEELIAMLASFEIATLADIRTIPRSRHNPQLNRDALQAALPKAGIRYVHLPPLGGLRHGKGAASPNLGWRNPSFRGFADYMLTEDFARGLEALRGVAQAGPVAIMCAEALPWRCHRSLVADALWARGVIAVHIAAPGKASPHRPTPFARFHGARVTYPALT